MPRRFWLTLKQRLLISWAKVGDFHGKRSRPRMFMAKVKRPDRERL